MPSGVKLLSSFCPTLVDRSVSIGNPGTSCVCVMLQKGNQARSTSPMHGNHEQGIALTMLVDEDGQPLGERLPIQFLHQVFRTASFSSGPRETAAHSLRVTVIAAAGNSFGRISDSPAFSGVFFVLVQKCAN
jgi:hypothetical protein